MKKKRWKVGYVYLQEQFRDPDKYFAAARNVIKHGDFTLGEALSEFESNFARTIGVSHAIGVGSGTDALYLPMRALGIKVGDEVIAAPNSFVASAAAIALTGARPVFIDVRDDYTMDPNLLEQAVTPRTKAIIPVHLTGTPADLYPIMAIVKKHNLFIIEDAAQAVLATYDHRPVGSFGTAGAFSFHPLKILNIWGDGGMITTNDGSLAQRLRLWRNHGLKNRNEVEFFAHNSRLHTFHAAIANAILPTLPGIIDKRAKLAALYDERLKRLEPYVHVPSRTMSQAVVEPVYATYVVQVKNRERLLSHLTRKGIEAVIQYPIPIHLQKAARSLGYKKGDFPVCEKQADAILTLPNHQYLTPRDVAYVCLAIEEFYRKK